MPHAGFSGEPPESFDLNRFAHGDYAVLMPKQLPVCLGILIEQRPPDGEGSCPKNRLYNRTKLRQRRQAARLRQNVKHVADPKDPASPSHFLAVTEFGNCRLEPLDHIRWNHLLYDLKSVTIEVDIFKRPSSRS